MLLSLSARLAIYPEESTRWVKKLLPVIIESLTLQLTELYISADKHGLDLCLPAEALANITKATLACILRDQ